MVLRWLAIAVALAGCNQSLFDSHGAGDGGGGGDGSIASTCPTPCIADAGGDFDGSPGGKGGKWRYLDDHRNRTWAAMTASSGGFVGADPTDTIKSCAHASGEGCSALPGGLLVSTSGSTTPADPAVELTIDANRTIELQLGVHPPAGGVGQTVRLYRNSREDVLFTGTADPGMTLSHTVTLDALAGDRFLVAIAPPAGGQADVGLQLFAVGANATFPTECELAVPFSGASGQGVANVCGSAVSAQDDNTGATTPTFGAGPYAELGQAATLVAEKYYQSATSLDRTGDVTVQLWLKHDMLIDTATGAWAFSDHDLDQGGGIGMVIYDNAGQLSIDVSTCTSPSPLTFDGVGAQYPADKQWHFVRVVHHKDAMMELCIDGARQGGKTLAGTLKSTYAPYFGRNVVWTPQGAHYIGSIDDVRVLTTALPCP